MGFTFGPTALWVNQSWKSCTADLSQGAGTYDLCTAVGGDIWINLKDLNIYCSQPATLLTSVSIQTNQTSPTVIMTSTEGLLANLLSQKNIVHAVPSVGLLMLKEGQKIRYTIVGVTGTGSLTVSIPYLGQTSGASLI